MVQILDGAGECAPLPVGERGLLGFFRMTIGADGPSPATLRFHGSVVAADGFENPFTYEMAVGAWRDDIESDRGWQLGATQDGAGNRLASGTYFLRLETREGSQSRQMTFVRGPRRDRVDPQADKGRWGETRWPLHYVPCLAFKQFGAEPKTGKFVRHIAGCSERSAEFLLTIGISSDTL